MMRRILNVLVVFLAAAWISNINSWAACQESVAQQHRQISGVWPHLAMWNSSNECGIGAVVPWANRLWVITYSPHSPQGSDDRLYSISNDLQIRAIEGSVGGTPANRLIHRETNQLVIGPYVIDANGNVRTIPPSKMPGRMTGTARHLFKPATKVYFATMEEGVYEVDLETLDVTEVFADNQTQVPGGKSAAETDSPRLAELPGYHGKGLYSGQGRLIYANNGEPSSDAMKRPDLPSGCLAEWDGQSDSWTVIRRNQFTDVRGPGGIFGNENPESDPVWAIGWDHRSLILMLLDQGQWFTYRLPKASHTYDGAHGWNTEWPRFQDIGDDDLVLNMHGMFWKFPKTFSLENSAGIAPRSTYLKVIGDYCRWDGQLVFGCDDSAKSEFLNKRKAKGTIAGPGQSHSNLWFASPSILDELGPPIGRGAVWIDDEVEANELSDPFLFSGFEKRAVHIVNQSKEPVTFTLEVDRIGNNIWSQLNQAVVNPGVAVWQSFDRSEPGVWLRLSTNRNCRATVQFHYSNAHTRATAADPMFDGLARTDSHSMSGGLVRVRGDGLKTLAFAAKRLTDGKASESGFYELDETLSLKRVEDRAALKWTIDNTPIPQEVISVDESSVLYIDDDGKRWRLPKGDAAFDSPGPLGWERLDREVATERDLFNCHGTFYELPAENAGGFAKIRPICTHNRRIQDYCSYRGLLIMSGVENDGAKDNELIIRSDDGRVAIWAGVIDDLWKFGKPVGRGGPWLETKVKANEFSDSYLMTGYDQKTLTLLHQSATPILVRAEVDITGTGEWVLYREFNVLPGETVEHQFPSGFDAYWIRFSTDLDSTFSATLDYE